MMIDCGEGSQNQMKLYHHRLLSLDAVLISHLHGDHWFGLPGLISSMHLSGRTKPLYLYAPKGLKPLIEAILAVSGSGLQYDLIIEEISPQQPEVLFENQWCKVTAFPLIHSVPTYGFMVEEVTPLPNVRKEAISRYDLTGEQCQAAKRGEGLTLADGTVVPNSRLVHPRKTPHRYAYCCDTAWFDQLPRWVEGVDMLCLECTFDTTLQSLADLRKHLTAKQAAEIAAAAHVDRLLLTHFSARYKDEKIEILEREAKSVFENVILAEEGSTLDV